MSLPALALVPIAGDVAGALARVPASAGVGQVLGPRGTSLLLAVTSNLRAWAGSHLGHGRPAAAGRRPKTNLAGLATAVGWVEADAPFRRRLIYERLVAPLVPLSARRDLKPPVFLQIDPALRFPRPTVCVAHGAPRGLFGPFLDRRAAEKALAALHRLFSLRPCDFVFEPDPALPLGLGCLYAQVRSCAAPCLARIGEEEYRALAARAAAWLGDPSARVGAPPAVPPTVGAADAARAVIVDAGRKEIGLYPVRAGQVLEAAAVVVPPAGLAPAVAALAWPDAERGDGDWPWLAAWLRSPKGRASYVLARGDAAALIAAVRSALPARLAGPAPDGMVAMAEGGV